MKTSILMALMGGLDLRASARLSVNVGANADYLTMPFYANIAYHSGCTCAAGFDGAGNPLGASNWKVRGGLLAPTGVYKVRVQIPGTPTPTAANFASQGGAISNFTVDASNICSLDLSWNGQQFLFLSIDRACSNMVIRAPAREFHGKQYPALPIDATDFYAPEALDFYSEYAIHRFLDGISGNENANFTDRLSFEYSPAGNDHTVQAACVIPASSALAYDVSEGKWVLGVNTTLQNYQTKVVTTNPYVYTPADLAAWGAVTQATLAPWKAKTFEYSDIVATSIFDGPELSASVHRWRYSGAWQKPLSDLIGLTLACKARPNSRTRGMWFTGRVWWGPNTATQVAGGLVTVAQQGLDIYYEHSNETWNTQFPQTKWLTAYLADGANSSAGGNAKRAFELYTIFKTVFANAGVANKLKNVFAVQSGLPQVLGAPFKAYCLAQGTTPAALVDNVAPSFYVDAGLYPAPQGNATAATTVEEVISAFEADVPRLAQRCLLARNMANDWGVKLAAYEGFLHYSTNVIPVETWNAALDSVRGGQVMRQALAVISPHTDGPVCVYAAQVRDNIKEFALFNTANASPNPISAAVDAALANFY